MLLHSPAIHHAEPLAGRAGAAASSTALTTSAGKGKAPGLRSWPHLKSWPHNHIAGGPLENAHGSLHACHLKHYAERLLA